MHYVVNFLHEEKSHALATSLPTVAHFETDGGGLIPNIGDVVLIGQSIAAGRPGYEGTVKNRLFNYTRAGICEVNIIFGTYHRGRDGE